MSRTFDEIIHAACVEMDHSIEERLRPCGCGERLALRCRATGTWEVTVVLRCENCGTDAYTFTQHWDAVDCIELLKQAQWKLQETGWCLTN